MLPDLIDRANIPYRTNLTLENCKKLSSILGKEKSTSLIELANRLSLSSRNAKKKKVLHGDLYARHLLIQNGKIAGIIDWGDMHIGDVAVDLAILRAIFSSTNILQGQCTNPRKPI